jgi:hypothetical protein
MGGWWLQWSRASMPGDGPAHLVPMGPQMATATVAICGASSSSGWSSASSVPRCVECEDEFARAQSDLARSLFVVSASLRVAGVGGRAAVA